MITHSGKFTREYNITTKTSFNHVVVQKFDNYMEISVNGNTIFMDSNTYSHMVNIDRTLSIDSRGYAYFTIENKKQVFIHNFALFGYGKTEDITVDHRNCKKLDNRLCNLRQATKQQQCLNQHVRKDSLLNVKGCAIKYWNDRPSPMFVCRIQIDGKRYSKSLPFSSENIDKCLQWLYNKRDELHLDFSNHGTNVSSLTDYIEKSRRQIFENMSSHEHYYIQNGTRLEDFHE